ncbi:hypothetical protein [Desulfoscipio gibsoniae]
MKTKKMLVCLAVILLSAIIYLAYDLQKQKIISTVNDVVTQYIEYSSTMQWKKAQKVLSGEALAQTIKNQDTATNKEKILFTELHGTINENLAIVDANVEKTGLYDDRQSYTFSLAKIAGEWKIYKVEYKDFTRPILGPYKENVAALGVLSDYLSLTAGKRREMAEKYLAGELLRATLVNRPLYSNQQVKELKETVVAINPVGSNDGYVAYQAQVVSRQEKSVTTTLLVDLVDVNGQWKIVNMDVLRVV